MLSDRLRELAAYRESNAPRQPTKWAGPTRYASVWAKHRATGFRPVDGECQVGGTQQPEPAISRLCVNWLGIRQVDVRRRWNEDCRERTIEEAPHDATYCGEPLRCKGENYGRIEMRW